MTPMCAEKFFVCAVRVLGGCRGAGGSYGRASALSLQRVVELLLLEAVDNSWLIVARDAFPSYPPPPPVFFVFWLCPRSCRLFLLRAMSIFLVS